MTGRLLVGLRWWEETNDAGESTWRYESLDAQKLKGINALGTGVSGHCVGGGRGGGDTKGDCVWV